MTRDELLATVTHERHNTRWWLTPDPHADEHRETLAAAIADWTDPITELANYRPTTEQRNANLIEDIEWLVDAGESTSRIANRLGRSIGALRIACDRAGRRDLARRFDHQDAA